MTERGSSSLYAVSSSRIGGRQSLRLFQESVRDVFDAAPIDGGATDSFRLDMRASHLGSVVLTEVHASALAFERDRRMVATAGIDHILIQLYTHGGYSGVADQDEIRVRAGDICILDLTRTLRTRTADFGNITLVLARPLLASALVDIDRLHGMVLAREWPVTRLLAAHIRTVAQKAPTIGPSDAEVVSRGTVALVARLIEGQLGDARAGVTTGGSPLSRILAFIEHNLHDPALGPAQIIGLFGLSRAALYRMFEHLGGVTELIRIRRLTGAAIELASGRGRRVSEIARAWGFVDDTSFSRAFRAHFGIAPREARDQSAMIWSQVRSGEADDAHLAYWLRTLQNFSPR